MRLTNDFVEDRWNIVAQSPFKSADYKTEKEKRRLNIDVCLVENPNIIVPINSVPVKRENRQTLRSVLTEIMEESKITENEIIKDRIERNNKTERHNNNNNNIQERNNNITTKHALRDKLKIIDPVTKETYEVGFCPNCGVATVKTDGCNYMKCSIGDRSFIPKELLPAETELCQQEWCFECSKPKFRPIPEKEYLGYCDDKSHNSH